MDPLPRRLFPPCVQQRIVFLLHRFRHDLVDALSHNCLLGVPEHPRDIFGDVENETHVVEVDLGLEQHAIAVEHHCVNAKFLVFDHF
jgi:hypothetical protein